MAERYQQFLGAKPGMIVELVDDSTSPYIVRAEDGFQFSVSAEDFKSYYRKRGTQTPAKWRPLITDEEQGLVESDKMAEVFKIIHYFNEVFHDLDKARSFVRDVLRAMGADAHPGLKEVRTRLVARNYDPATLSEKDMHRLEKLPKDIRERLLSESCAVIPFLEWAAGSNGEKASTAETNFPAGAQALKARPKHQIARKTMIPRVQKGGMKNVEFHLDGEILTITVDLSKEFGPSKSGKTTIIASTQGNKTLPGRDEKIGLNVYKATSSKTTKGRRKEFKNVSMSVQGDILTLVVDLSKEAGPSKSGLTIIVASTEGNHSVYGREEKIGLNVYKKIE